MRTVESGVSTSECWYKCYASTVVACKLWFVYLARNDFSIVLDFKEVELSLILK